MQRLTSGTLHQLPLSVARPEYDRNRLQAGIVHLGVGAFHRAHQAVYTDDAIQHSGGNWGIIGASLRSPHAARQLNPQDGLYTLCTESEQGQEQRVVGALQRVLVAPEEPAALDAAIADPSIHVVTLTVTEKGYCLGDDGWSLNAELPTVISDLENPAQASTAIGVLARGLSLRHRNRGAPLTIISCDNLNSNSRRLQTSLIEFLQRSFPGIVPWVNENVRFPCSMVDRIVPAVSNEVLTQQSMALGLRDEAAVVTEPFSQWVIEDNFATPTPDWKRAGATLVADIAPFESTKLRMLNASHSAIAYVGLLAGMETVADVMQDPQLGDSIRRLMKDELLPAISPPPNLDMQAYSNALLQRFANPCLHHRCAQIAMDGSEKIPLRWQQTLLDLPQDGLLLKSLACWCYVILDTSLPIEDPRRSELVALRKSTAGLREKLKKLLRILRFTDASQNSMVQALQGYHQQLAAAGVRDLLAG